MIMSLTRLIRDVLKRPEAIPTLGAIIYNVTVARVLRKPEIKIANDIVETMRNGTILDLGSGTGYLSIEIAKRTPCLRVYGIDLSRQMVKIARRRAKGIENAQFVFGNAAKLPFKNDSIDLVISTGASHHWKTPGRVFDECYRVLKTGKEVWTYDGCPDVFKDQAARRRVRKEYGFLVYQFGRRVADIHGFTRREYQTEIKGILDQTKFRDSYEMAPTDIWMKITLKKQ
jgi:ubiquinone/menaquinone biosynthesis C-methylase UbiE